MRTVVNNREVPHLWMHQTQESGRNSTGSLYFEGPTIYSYGPHFPIARHVQNKRSQGAILVTTRGYSSTTSGHIGSVRSAIPNGATVFYVPLENHDATVPFADYVESYQKRIDEHAKFAVKAKGRASEHYCNMLATTDQANAYCEFFGLRKRFKKPKNLAAIKATIEESERKRLEAAKRREALVRREAQEKLARWLEGESVQVPSGLPEAYLRIRDNVVETSKGAHFPVDDAPRGIALARACRKRGREWQRNGETCPVGDYQIDRVYPNGDVRAGCHLVHYSEVERIAGLIGA